MSAAGAGAGAGAGGAAPPGPAPAAARAAARAAAPAEADDADSASSFTFDSDEDVPLTGAGAGAGAGTGAPGGGGAGAPSAAAAVDPLDAHFVAHAAADPFLLLHRAVYFFGMGANAAYFPFAVQLWSAPEGAGLDMAACGAVYAAGHLAGMVAAPALAAVADSSERARRAVLVGGFVGQAAAVALMAGAHSFAAVVACQVLVEASGGAIWTGVDAATQRLLVVTRGSAAEYGNSRAFGAAGWGLCALAFGVVFDRFSLRAAFPLFCATSLPAALLAARLPLEKRGATGAGRAAALRAIATPAVALVLGVVLVTAVLLQIVDVFRFPFLASVGASNALLGGSLAVTAASEAPFFFVTSALLRRVSLKAALCCVLAGYAVRFVYYSAIGAPPLEDPAWTLPAELLHGFTFALGWAAATQYVAVLLPPELAASAQGLLAAVQWGLGSALGSAGGGAVARAFGWRAMWRAGAALAAATLALFVALGKRDAPGAQGAGGGEAGAGAAGAGAGAGGSRAPAGAAEAAAGA